MVNNPPKLLYFVTEDWYFCSHRLALAKAAKQAGFEVSVLTRVSLHGEVIRNAGINLIPLDLERGGIHPVRELLTLFRVAKTYWRLKPDLVHHVALKPVLYGSIVSLFMPRLGIVNLLAGLGTIFSSKQNRARLLRPGVEWLFRALFRRRSTVTIVQNHEDYCLLLERLRIPVGQVRLIRGSGVDLGKFQSTPEPPGEIALALVSRLLWDKGIGEYVNAVRLLKQKGLQFTAYLVGKPDAENMASVNEEQLRDWNNEGFVECLGHQDDIAKFWRSVHVAVLPSYYGEGIPKCLIEAAACGRPIVSSDIAGCREIVDDGHNGICVPQRDVNALAEALEKLILDKALRVQMGACGREKVEQEFADGIVLQETLGVYREMIGHPAA